MTIYSRRRTQDSRLKTQDSRRKMQDTRRKTQGARFETQDASPLSQRRTTNSPLYQRGVRGDSTHHSSLATRYSSLLTHHSSLITRYSLLVTILYLALHVSCLAAGEDGFTIARVKYGGGGDWYVGQTQIPNLLEGLGQRTTMETADKQEVIKLTDKELYLYPFIYMTGHGNVSFTEDEVEALHLYLTRGGFLWANDDYGMDKSFRREMKRVFPGKDLVEVPFDHELYHCYYDFPSGLPKIHEHDGKPPRGYGIFHEGRMVVFYDYESDIGDGLENPEVHNDPPEKREQALRMAINVVIYALTH